MIARLEEDPEDEVILRSEPSQICFVDVVTGYDNGQLLLDPATEDSNESRRCIGSNCTMTHHAAAVKYPVGKKTRKAERAT